MVCFFKQLQEKESKINPKEGFSVLKKNQICSRRFTFLKRFEKCQIRFCIFALSVDKK